MKIAIIGTTAAMMINFRQDLIKMLISKQYQVFAFALDYTDATKKTITEMGATPTDYIFSKTGLNPFSDLKNTYYLSKIIKKIQPDIVFSYVAKPVIFGTLAAKLAGIKNTYGMIEGLGYAFTLTPEKPSIKKQLIKNIQVLLYRFSLPLLNRLIVLNADDKFALENTYKIKVNDCQILGGIGLNLTNFPYTPVNHYDKISFIFIARLLKEKGINEYISAATLLHKKYSNIEFRVLGDIDEKNPGSLQIQDLEKLTHNKIISYIGYVKNVNEWLQNSSVFILPSYREGMPRSTQEAMATGRAVITTDVPGCKDTVIDGKNGFLIPPWDIPALVNAMEQFISNPGLIQTMGEESRKIAEEHFDAQKVNHRLLQLLDIQS